MTEHDTAGNTLQTSQQETLLKQAPQEAVDLLGKNRIIQIETAFNQIAYLTDVTKEANPFKVADGKVDFSFAPKKDVSYLEERGLIHVPLETAKKALRDKRPLWAALRIRKLRKIGDGMNESCSLLADGAEKNVIDIEGYLSQYNAGDVTTLLEERQKLSGTAKTLPNPATLDAVNNIFELAKVDLSIRVGLVQSTSVGRTNIVSTGTDHIEQAIERGKKRSIKVRQRVKDIRNDGYKMFNVTTNILKLESLRPGGHLLDLITEAKTALEYAGLDENQLPGVLVTEDYLVQRADYVKRLFSKIDPEFFKEDNIDERVKPLFETTIADTETAQAEKRKRAELRASQRDREERAKDLNVQVSEARDILLGGSRLGNGKNKPDIREKAEALRAIMLDDSRKIRLLGQEQSGLIIAIIYDRYASFTDTLSRIQGAGEHDEIIQTVEQGRPNVVRDIRDFDLTKTTDRLQEILLHEHTRAMLLEVLEPRELAKLQDTLTKD